MAAGARKFKIVVQKPSGGVTYDLADSAYSIEREALDPIGAEIVEVPAKTEEEFIAAAQDADAVIARNRRITAAIIKGLRNCKVIGLGSVGADTVDVDAATEAGIVVTNVPDVFIDEVADHTMAMFLAAHRRLRLMHQLTVDAKWTEGRPYFKDIPRLYGQTIGLISFGNVAKAVARRCHAFGLHVISYDPYLAELEMTAVGVEPVTSLLELCGRADFLSMHAPLNSETHHMMSDKQFKAMKKSAIFINNGRGPTVDEKALIEALKQRDIAGAALDVFEQEPPAADHPLFSCPNFIGTPHLGGSTEDAQQNVATIVCEAMVDYLTTGTVRNAVNVPSVSGEVLERLGPFLRLCEKMGALSGQLALEGQTSTAPEQIEIAYAGEVAEQPTAPLTAAVLKGVLGTFLAEPVNEVSAPALAKERGLSVTESKSNETPDFASLVTVRLRAKPGITEVAGTIIGKREPRIVRVNEFEVEAAPQGTLLVMVNQDKPGVIGNVGRTLGEAQVNIAQFALARVAETGRALALVNVDGTASPETLEKLRKLPHVLEVRQVVL